MVDKKIAFIFPGQGAQYTAMGKDFFEKYFVAKEVFEEADDLLHFPLAKLIFSGPLEDLTLTRNAQLAIFVVSIALLKVLQKELPDLTPFAAAGLSLGEYTALTAAEKLSFQDALLLVQKRAEFMHEACEKRKGAMAAVLGLDAEMVETLLAPLAEDLVWPANFNSPGQTVISGTEKGVEKALLLLKEKGAKKIIPLKVHGAFHSGLMEEAKIKLTPYIEKVEIKPSDVKVALNVTGDLVEKDVQIRQNLILQVTNPVRWQKCIETLDRNGIDFFIEIGPGKTLSAMNKKIAPKGRTLSLEKTEDLQLIYEEIYGTAK